MLLSQRPLLLALLLGIISIVTLVESAKYETEEDQMLETKREENEQGNRMERLAGLLEEVRSLLTRETRADNIERIGRDYTKEQLAAMRKAGIIKGKRDSDLHHIRSRRRSPIVFATFKDMFEKLAG
ncbi:hypothetical protein FKM82_025345 [Ascaphus truei]